MKGPDKKNKFIIRITRNNFKRPRHPETYDSPLVFNNFISQCIDKIDHGRAKGIRKSHALINKYLGQRNSQSTHNITLRVKIPITNAYLSNAPHVKYINSIEEHLNGDYFVYFQGRSDSFIDMIKKDFDSIDCPDAHLYDDIHSTICSQRQSFEGSYFDHGSSSESLNQFLLIDSEPLYDFYFFNQDKYSSFQRFMCNVYNNISRLLRFAYNNPSPVQLPHNLKFDGIKGTPANYEYFIHNGRVIHTKILNSGVFGKLPRPTSTEQFHALYNMPIVDITVLINFALHLFDISVPHFHPRSEKEQRYLRHALTAHEFLSVLAKKSYSLVGDVFLPCQSENTPRLEIPPSITPSTPYIVTLPGNPHLEQKNEGLEVREISDEYSQNANIRRWAILPRLTREYYAEHGEKPTNHWRERQYRLHPASTGEADEQDIQEIYEICELIDKEFKPEKVGSGRIVITRESIEDDSDIVQAIISQEQINQIKNSHGNSYEKIRVSDRDIAIGQAYFVDKSMKSKERKEQHGLELTVATESMSEFTQQLLAKSILKRSETWKDQKKCRAIRYVLEHIGWIECLDADWDKGISKRWGIGKEYHRYKEFVEYVGETTIGRVRNKGLASMEDWDNMGQTA